MLEEPLSKSKSSNPPDWDLVPFEVGCARCGHDLRGRTDPTCPACDLTFDWADAVPIERLVCAHCDYHLYGLQDTRCPECGIAFTWEEVLADYHRKRIPLFEYRWRDRPVRSFVGTCVRSLRPVRFWDTTDIHAPVYVGPLIAFVVTVLFGCFSMFVLLLAGVQWLYAWESARRWPIGGYPGLLEFVLFMRDIATNRAIWAFLISLTMWVVAVLAALMVFRQSMSRCKLRNVHVIRVWAYVTPVVPVLLVVALSSVSAVSILSTGRPFHVPPLVIVVLMLVACTSWSTHIAYRRYLHMPHSIGVAAASQIMALLLASIGDFVVSTTWSRGGIFVQTFVQLFSSGRL